MNTASLVTAGQPPHVVRAVAWIVLLDMLRVTTSQLVNCGCDNTENANTATLVNVTQGIKGAF